MGAIEGLGKFKRADGIKFKGDWLEEKLWNNVYVKFCDNWMPIFLDKGSTEDLNSWLAPSPLFFKGNISPSIF